MRDDDNEFFILVLGVLAAIILVISWWYTSGGISTPQVATQAAPAPAAAPTEEPAEAAAPVVESEPEAEPTPAPTAVPTPEPTAAPAETSVVDVMLGDGDLSVITSLLREEGLDGVLSDTAGGPFTVFAPSNDAVNAAAASDTTVALLEQDRASVLTYHVVTGNYTADKLRELAADGGQLVSLQGEPLALSLDGDALLVNGNATIRGNDQAATNGLVHTLDNVLVPPISALNTIVTSEPILFASGSSEIQAESFATLDRFTEVLSGSTVDVSIEGHTDSSGDPVLNQNLSQSRARAVLNYLVANGVDESRLSATGFGPNVPVADNNTEEGRALNRRIEFTLGG